MSAVLVVSLDEQIACIARAIRMRELWYPKLIDEKKMLQSRADHELAAMRAALEEEQRGYLGASNHRDRLMERLAALQRPAEDALAIVRRYIEEAGGCDHSVNICMCEVICTADTLSDAIAGTRPPNDPGTIEKLNAQMRGEECAEELERLARAYGREGIMPEELVDEAIQCRECAEELADLVEDHLRGIYVIDSLTTQPIRRTLAGGVLDTMARVMEGPRGGAGLAQGPTWADGMERAAELCDEEAHSAEALLEENPGARGEARVRITTISDTAQGLARTIRAFKDAGQHG